MNLKQKLIGVALALTTLVASSAPQGIMVAAYFTPGPKWDAMNWAATRVPLIAIMNPNSGPGTSQSGSYITALANLHAAGGKIIGYVSSDYTRRSLTDVKADIDKYITWYAVDGFFIDEMTNDADPNHLDYYASIYEYVKLKGAQYSVTGNPGSNTPESYLSRPTADMLMNFESGSAQYATYTPSSWVFNYSPDHFVHLPYGVVGTTALSNYVSLAASRNAGWIYISDLTTYSALPTYWTNEVNLVQSQNGTNSLPVILDPTQPADQKVDLGDPVTFQVTAFGPAPLSYQWYVTNAAGTNAILHATNSIYTIPSVQPADVGGYYVQVSNTNGAVKSRIASLTIKPNTFKHITIDGAFDDWAGIPPAHTQLEDTSTSGVAFKDLYIANDEDYLYVRFTIYGSPTSVFTGFQNYFFNTDNNPATGFAASGTGSELLIQGGVGYRETNGVFNAGAVNGLNWQALPAVGTEFEFRVSRHATNAVLNTPVFPGIDLMLRLESEPAPNHSPSKWYPSAGSGVPYSFSISQDVVIPDPNQPADQYAVQGHPVTFNIVATGAALIQYQWYHGATEIVGATNDSCTIASVSPSDAGGYHVLVSNPVSSTNSRNALLTVLPDAIAPAVTNIAATPGQILLTFSEPLDITSATNVANYALSGGVSVAAATFNGQVVTLTTGSPLSPGAPYSLAINGVKDVFGNAAHSIASFSPTIAIAIDGSFNDWTGIAPVYSTATPSPNEYEAADFKDVYVYNDDNYYYFRVTLWRDIPPTDGSGCFPRRANLHYNTDGNSATGFGVGIGSELLNQSGFFYQEKNGNFNDNVPPVGMDYLIQPATRPASYPASFEWRYSRKATFGGGGLIFSTNAISFFFQGNDQEYVPRYSAPTTGGVIAYTNVAPVAVPGLPLGELALSPLPGGKLALTWDSSGMLQCCDSLQNNSWTNLPAATSPYIVPSAGQSRFFRLVK